MGNAKPAKVAASRLQRAPARKTAGGLAATQNPIKKTPLRRRRGVAASGMTTEGVGAAGPKPTTAAPCGICGVDPNGEEVLGRGSTLC